MRHALVQSLNAVSEWKGQQEEHQHSETVELEGKIGVADQNLRLPDQLRHGDDGSGGAVLDRDDRERTE